MTFRTSEALIATRISDDKKVSIQLTDLQFFSYGAFSNVYRGLLHLPPLTSNERAQVQDVVIKKTWFGLNKKSSNDEIQILKTLGRLNHKNIVKLLYTFRHEYPDSVCFSLIFEFLDVNLYQYLKSCNRCLALIETKMFTWQLFRGLFHLQRANICHRDIKPQNLLVNPESGLLKIGDFGASTTDPNKVAQPSYHVTRYYRPPELLLGSTRYGVEIDIWSAGCVFGEMLRGNVLFIGSNSNDQMDTIMSVMGLPTTSDVKEMNLVSNSKWKEAKSRFNSGKIKACPWKIAVPVTIKNSISVSFEAVEILKEILTYNPNKRLHGSELLLHPFFSEIFRPEVRRPGGKRIRCLTHRDLQEVRNGDKSMTGSTNSPSIESFE
ncbi:unnamed protein product [Auanema sp. JU1783]|nr:unnamed protein product [Auanema sp. JU1783]